MADHLYRTIPITSQHAETLLFLLHHLFANLTNKLKQLQEERVNAVHACHVQRENSV
jgi:hypothetical protein